MWPYITDTNRFNRDTGLASVSGDSPGFCVGENATRKLAMNHLGVRIEWIEEPFEWEHPHTFGVRRYYQRGPVARMDVRAHMRLTEDGGTQLDYTVSATPRTALGVLAIPLQIGLLSRRAFTRIFRAYAEQAAARPRNESFVAHAVQLGARSSLDEDADARLRAQCERIGGDAEHQRIAGLIAELIRFGDPFSVGRMQPYLLAAAWGERRRSVLEVFLRATRVGMLDLRWEVLCPLCKGAKATADSLLSLEHAAYCECCRIDIAADFAENVELCFHPNAAVRVVDFAPYCVAGPQTTPHIAVQQLLVAGEARVVRPILEPGRYRIRALETSAAFTFDVEAGGPATASVRFDGDWHADTTALHTEPEIELLNTSPRDRLLVVERTAWREFSLTAAEVTALQEFRDLFAREVLRPGQQVAVGSLTVLFTDLKGSTALYQEIGDAPAFGRVLDHFELLRDVIREENGAVVKSIGDAVMAVFQSPAAALRALRKVHVRMNAGTDGLPAASLKAAVHVGPCLAVTLNERLYFGSTVNRAARLNAISTGGDVVVSTAVLADPEVAALLRAHQLQPQLLDTELKGFGDRGRDAWRVPLSARA